MICRGLLLIALLSGLVLGGAAIFELLHRRVALLVVAGSYFWPLLILQVVGVAAQLLVLVREFRVRPIFSGAGWPQLRLLLVLVVTTAGVSAFYFNPYSTLKVLFAFAMTFGIYGLLLLFERSLVSLVPGRLLRVLDIALFNICLLLVLGESALRAFGEWRPSPLFSRVGQSVQSRIDNARYEPGTLRFGFPVNAGGHYDGEFQAAEGDEKVVVSLGDSFSSGVVPHPYHFTSVCEDALDGVAVHNIGVPSIGPHEYLYLLRNEALALRPSAILVNIFLGNDLRDSLWAPSDFNFWRDIASRENLLLYQVPRRLLAMKEEGELMEEHGLAAGELSGERGAAIYSEDEMDARFPWLKDYRSETPHRSEKSFIDMELARVKWVCGPRTEHLGPTRDVILKLRDAAGDVPLIVVLIPDEFQVEDRLWETLLQTGVHADVQRNMVQQDLVPWMESEGIPCLDLLPVLRGVPEEEDGWRHVYLLRDSHFNARGNRVAGEAMAEILKPYL